MSVSGVNTNTPVGTPAATDGRTRLAESFDTFLTLLTTQMKNQDPTSPMDSTQFTQQIVQMTGVEQQLQTNDLLKQLVTNTASGVQAAVSLIGKDVRAVTDTTALKNGSATWLYKLDNAATDLKLEILDSKGNVVANAAPTGDDRKAGEHSFTWDGKSSSGTKLADGDYTLRVTAKDSAGATVGSTTYVQGAVTSVEQADGSTYLTINGGKVDWSKVTTITQPAAPATTTTTTTTTTGDTQTGTSTTANNDNSSTDQTSSSAA